MTIKDRGIPKPYGTESALATPPCDLCGNIEGACEDRVNVSNDAVVTSFAFTPYGGVSTVITIPASVGAIAVRNAIAAALLANYEQNVFIYTIPGNGQFTLIHQGYGAITLVGILEVKIRFCNVAESCLYKFIYTPSADPADDIFTNGITNTNLAAFADAAALAALLDPLLSATGSVAVVFNATNDVYEIEISDLSPQVYKLNGVGFLRCKCKPIFVGPSVI